MDPTPARVVQGSDGVWECEICGVDKGSKAALATHKLSHGIKIAARRKVLGSTCPVCRRDYHGRAACMEHIHHKRSRVCLVNLMLFHPDCEDEAVEAADIQQAKQQAAARARCVQSNYHDELACQIPAPLQRFLIPDGHSRSSRYPMMSKYVKDSKAAREVCFEESEADLYRGTEALEEHIPFVLLHMCKHS